MRFGGIGGFLTPNVADTRNPLVVTLHGGCITNEAGGFNKEGDTEKYTVKLLDESPAMPTAAKMLEILAENPVAQARFFVISMRLFLEHVLGLQPFNEQLRANGTSNGVKHPDGTIAAFVGDAFAAVAHLHGPIEEQARLSCHPHIVLHFVNRMSQMWLRRVLLLETDEAKSLLRGWQRRTLQAVESLMSSCAGLMPLHFQELPFRDVTLKGLPYLQKWQEEDKFDGALEDCKKDKDKRRLLVPVEEAFVDLHMRDNIEKSENPSVPISGRKRALTGSVMARLPHYRLPPGGFSGCECEVCDAGRHSLRNMSTEEYIKAFCEDLHGVCALSGHLHEHQATCFKYAPEGSRRKPQHCRFNFVHFEKLFREKKVASGLSDYTVIKEVIIARTGKPILLPQWLSLKDSAVLSGADFVGQSDLGSRVDVSTDGARRGRVQTVQYNPREGQCFPVSWIKFFFDFDSLLGWGFLLVTRWKM